MPMYFASKSITVVIVCQKKQSQRHRTVNGYNKSVLNFSNEAFQIKFQEGQSWLNHKARESQASKQVLYDVTTSKIDEVDSLIFLFIVKQKQNAAVDYQNIRKRQYNYLGPQNRSEFTSPTLTHKNSWSAVKSHTDQYNHSTKQSQRTNQIVIRSIPNKIKTHIINVEMIDYQYYQGAAIALIVINSVSFLALVFVITIYLIRWKKIASFPMRLSFYLCLSCLIQNLYILIYPPIAVYDDQAAGQEADGFCIFQSMLKTASDLSSIIWTLIIIYSSYATVVRGYTLERLELFYLCVGFLLPILLALIPIFLNLYGYNYYFCWFNTQNPSTLFGLKMGYYFAPLWLFFFLEIFFAFKTYQRLKSVGLHGRELNIFKKILLFPIILLVTGFFATADMIYKFVSGGFSEWLDVISIILLSIYGILISLAYGFNPLIRDQILILFNKKPQSEIRYSSTTTQTSRKTDQIAELITM